MALQRIEYNNVVLNRNQFWSRPFNQCVFMNYGATAIEINKIPVPSGTQLPISLNVGEVNTTTYNIDFLGATDGEVWILSTEYI